MITRILLVVLTVLLALPMTASMPSVSARTQPQEQAASILAAKKDRKTKPKFRTVVTTVTRTVRQPITQTFSNSGVIVIPFVGAPFGEGLADPYPATIQAGGFTNGTILDVNLILTNLSHKRVDDLDVMLTATHLPDRTALVINDIGFRANALPNTTLVLDDQALTQLPSDGDFGRGTFQPTSGGQLIPDLPPPAPAVNGNPLLGVFTGADPNGTWHLFTRDETDGKTGTLGGWSLQITAEVDVQIQEQVEERVKIKPKNKAKKKR